MGFCWQLRITVLGLLASLSGKALADQYHYNNLLIGTRALGMGGAFCALADDASGIHYNPAGLAYALSNDISGSANAFYSKKVEYKKVLENDSFIEKSGGSVAPFFGGLQKLDRYVPGLVAAFGVYHTDSDLKDQDTPIKDKAIGSAYIESYHRTSNARASTMYGGAAAGYRLTPHVAIGFGLNYVNVEELVQEYQDTQQSLQVSLADGTKGTAWTYSSQNVREYLVLYGYQPTLGVQISLPFGLALGLTVKKGFIASQKFESGIDAQSSSMSDAQKSQLDGIGRTNGTLTNIGTNNIYENPLGGLPLEGRFGLAWFMNPRTIWALDVAYHSAVTNAKDPLLASGTARFNKEAVLNYHAGLEWYATPSFPVRLGAFTNNDARPKVLKGEVDAASGQSCANPDYAKKYCNQPDHIDYFGESLFIAWVQPNTQTAAGVILQQGSGKGQKLANSSLVQDVTASSLTFAFSATTNL
jgi:hypothetical protein